MDKKTARNVAVGTVIVLGLAWKVTEELILRNKSRALIYDSASIRAKDPIKKEEYRRLSDKFAKRATLAEIVQSLNPSTYIIPPLKRLYERYLTVYYKEAGKY